MDESSRCGSNNEQHGGLLLEILVLGGMVGEQKAERASNHGDGPQVGKSRKKISSGFIEVANDQRSEVGTEIADSVDETHNQANGLGRQGFGGNGPERRHGSKGADTAQDYEHQGQQQRIGDHSNGEKNERAAKRHGGGGVLATLTGLVRVASDKEQSEGPENEWEGVDDASVQTAELLEVFGGAGQPEKQAHLAADKAEVDGGEDENLRSHQSAEVGDIFGTFEKGRFSAKHSNEGFAFGW